MALTVAQIPTSSDIIRSTLNQEDRSYVENYDYDNYNTAENSKSRLFIKCVVNTGITLIAVTVLVLIVYYFSNYFSHDDYDSYYSILIVILILVCIAVVLFVIIRSFVNKSKL
jgi:O-antigen/teichoic acid export membrane protein